MPADVDRGVGDVTEAHGDRTVQPRAVAGQLQVAPLALEHGGAQMLFQQLDLAADRRLGQAQLLAGAGEIEQPAGRLQHHEAVHRRQLPAQLGHELSSSIDEDFPGLAGCHRKASCADVMAWASPTV